MKEEGGTVEVLFHLAMTAELNAAYFYRSLQRMFSHQSAVAAFWEDMLEDEERHSRELQLIYNELPPGQFHSPADIRIIEKARRNLETPIGDKLNKIRTLDDAYQFAHELENSEIMTVFAFIREKYVPPSLRERFTFSQIDEHVDKIMNFPAAFGDAEARKIIQRQELTPA